MRTRIPLCIILLALSGCFDGSNNAAPGRDPSADRSQAKGLNVLEIEVLKTYQCGSQFACIDFSVTNKSKIFLGTWTVAADVYDSKGQYLGHSKAIGNNLRPHQSATEKLIFDDLQAPSIAKWKLAFGDYLLEQREGGNKEDVMASFELNEKRR